jgi:hypothetical protein
MPSMTDRTPHELGIVAQIMQTARNDLSRQALNDAHSAGFFTDDEGRMGGMMILVGAAQLLALSAAPEARAKLWLVFTHLCKDMALSKANSAEQRLLNDFGPEMFG